MHAFGVGWCRVVATLAVLAIGYRAYGQIDGGSKNGEKTTLASGVVRMHATHAPSSIEWVRLLLSGTAVRGAAGTSGPPLLIAQCTRFPNGQFKYEMFASFGDATDLGFYPPWKPTSSQDLFPPRTQKVTFTMEFLGYTHVKPLRRQWEIPVETAGLYRFSPPGSGSSNLEEIAFDLRYLLALPTMRLSLADRTAEFATTPLLAEIRKEPLCRAAGL
jgi:hypothetical protein